MRAPATLAFLLSIAACLELPVTNAGAKDIGAAAAVDVAIVLAIDEESIDNGTRNYLEAGFDDNGEALLDKIPAVTPLRATGLAMLVGETICAVVNQQGASLGIVAALVLGAVRRFTARRGRPSPWPPRPVTPLAP